MKAEGEKVKRLVDEVVSRNIEQVDKIEESLNAMLQSQDETYNGYISYLNNRIKEFRDHQASTDSLKLISITEDMLESRPIPETTKPVLPVFTIGHYRKDDIVKLLGKVIISTTKPISRKFKPKENEYAQLESTEKQTNHGREKSNATLSLSSSVTMVKEYTVPGVDEVCHVSLCESGKLWVSDRCGSLVQIDLEGKLLQNLKSSGYDNGFHTVTQDEDLIYTDNQKKLINRITPENCNTVSEFIKTGDWNPLSIHSSHINGDILMGMIKNKEAKVTRYSKTGNEVQNMQKDNEGEALFRYPRYITENINGDICTSDYNKHAVVVMNKSGKHRFSYRGHDVMFRPRGICTDVLGHILVCASEGNFFSKPVPNVHLLNQDGYLLHLMFPRFEIGHPLSVCVDDENNLHVGTGHSNEVRVYKYLK